MLRYFFHLRNDIDVPDEEGRECEDDAAAIGVALDEARTMAARSALEGHLKLSHSITVTDSEGRTVSVVRFGDAVTVEA